jgi:hypothetical protein
MLKPFFLYTVYSEHLLKPDIEKFIQNYFYDKLLQKRKSINSKI